MADIRGLAQKILPPAGLPRQLSLQSAIFAVGVGVYLTGSVVFFKLYVGLSATQIGIGLSAAGFLSLAGSLPLGHLADRIGGKRAWLAGGAVSMVSFAAYPLAHGFWSFLLVLGAETLGEVLADSGRAVYTAAAIPREIRVRTLAFSRAYLNVGITVGTGVGAAAIALDSRAGLLALMLVTAAGVGVNLIFVSRMPAAYAERTGERERTASPWAVLRDHPYMLLAAVFAMLYLSETIFAEIMPLWMITMTDAPRPVLGALFALNTVLAVLLQVRATRGAGTLAGAARLSWWSALAVAVACPVLALSGATHGWPTIAVLAVAVLLTTACELWSSAAQWYFNVEVPPPAQRGAYLGAARSVTGVMKMAGPAALTFLAIRTGGWGWWVVAAAFVATAATVPASVSWLSRTPRNDGVVTASAVSAAR